MEIPEHAGFRFYILRVSGEIPEHAGVGFYIPDAEATMSAAKALSPPSCSCPRHTMWFLKVCY